MAAAAEEAPAAPAAGGLRALTTKREAFRGEMQVRSPPPFIPPPPPRPSTPRLRAPRPGLHFFCEVYPLGFQAGARAPRRGRCGGGGGGGLATWPGPARFPLHWAACPLGLTKEARPSPHLFCTRRHG